VNKDQRDITHARDLLFQHFPRIPRDSAEEILKHGFLKGSGRVGRSTTLDEELKIELAVNAHIRHRFTNYDSLYSQLKTTNIAGDLKKQARTKVYDQVNQIAYSWRGLGVVPEGASSAKSAESSDIPDEMMSELEGVDNEAGDTPQLQLCYRTLASHQGRDVTLELRSQRQRPPQCQAAMAAALSFTENHSFKAQVTESSAHRATSEDYPSRLHKNSGKAPGTKSLERALDHMNLEDEAFKDNKPKELADTSTDLVRIAGDRSARREHRHVHHRSANRDFPAGKSRAKPNIAEVYEEQAKKDMELLKLDIDHRENMSKRRFREVARLEKKISSNDFKDASGRGGDEFGNYEDKGQHVAKPGAPATDPKRASKLMKRKQTREKHAIDDLRQYELDPGIKLPKKRMNRVRNLQENLAKEYGNRRYQKMLEKRRRDFKAEVSFATTSGIKLIPEVMLCKADRQTKLTSWLIQPSSNRPNIGPKGEAATKFDGLAGDSDWMDIS